MVSAKLVGNFDNLDSLTQTEVQGLYDAFKSGEPVNWTDPKFVLYRDYFTAIDFTFEVGGRALLGGVVGAAAGGIAAGTEAIKVGLMVGGLTGVVIGGVVGVGVVAYFLWKNEKVQVPQDATFTATKEQITKLKEKLDEFHANNNAEAIGKVRRKYKEKIKNLKKEIKDLENTIDEDRKTHKEELKQNTEQVERECTERFERQLEDLKEKFDIKDKKDREDKADFMKQMKTMNSTIETLLNVMVNRETSQRVEAIESAGD